MSSKADLKKFSNYGRMLSILCALVFPGLGLYSWITTPDSTTAIYCVFISPVMMIIELPTCCGCMSWCKAVDKYTRWLTRFWFTRAILYIGVTAAYYAIYQTTSRASNPWSLMLPNIALDVAAACYLIATFRREPVPILGDGGNVQYEANNPNNGAAAAAATGFFGWARKNPDAAKAAVAAGAAAAPTLAQQYFGGSDPENPTAAPATTVAVAQPTSPADGLLTGKRKESNGSNFGGGGLFGSKSYGDVPEANPFG